MHLHTLSNGLRVVTIPSEGSVCHMGMLINAGSRNDLIQGTAHFVEHTLFKGTKTRKSWQISNRLELIGGELNAYTSKEEIMVYATVPAGYEKRAAELLGDLAANPTFPEAEVERERGVILEEFSSYADAPASAVIDEFDERFFALPEMAHNILGYPDTISQITSGDLKDFTDKWFVPSNMIVYCLSPTAEETTLKLISKYFGNMEPSFPTRDNPPAQISPCFTETCDRNHHQANTLMGAPLFGYGDPRRHAFSLLSNLLGGPAMNSRLNRELRDKRGLVYSVDTSISLYSDCGQFQFFYACDPKRTAQCRKLILREVERLAASPLSERSFTQARDQMCGQLLVNGDRRSSTAMLAAISTLRYGEPQDNRKKAEAIRRVTRDQLREAAETLAGTPVSSLSII